MQEHDVVALSCKNGLQERACCWGGHVFRHDLHDQAEVQAASSGVRTQEERSDLPRRGVAAFSFWHDAS